MNLAGESARIELALRCHTWLRRDRRCNLGLQFKSLWIAGKQKPNSAWLGFSRPSLGRAREFPDESALIPSRSRHLDKIFPRQHDVIAPNSLGFVERRVCAGEQRAGLQCDEG